MGATNRFYKYAMELEMKKKYRVQGFIQDFISIRLKLIASNFHTPKPMILYYVYGELPKFSYA